jgi:hypothetical protein
MSVSREAFERPLPQELVAVAEAAGARLRAAVAADPDEENAATQGMLAAATAAISAKYSLVEIAQAEARGKARVRGELGGDALKRVERSGSRARESEAEHHREIGRAMRLGLSMREIALAAGVTHGTIRAIGHRLAGDDVSEATPPDEAQRSDGEFAAPSLDAPETALVGETSPGEG